MADKISKPKSLPPGARWHTCKRCGDKYWHFTSKAGACDKNNCYEKYQDKKRSNIE